MADELSRKKWENIICSDDGVEYVECCENYGFVDGHLLIYGGSFYFESVYV